MSKKSEKNILFKKWENVFFGNVFGYNLKFIWNFQLPRDFMLTYVLGDERPVDQTNIF